MKKFETEAQKTESKVGQEKLITQNDIEIEVKNQGAPIPDDEKDKIFERFYRVDKAK